MLVSIIYFKEYYIVFSISLFAIIRDRIYSIYCNNAIMIIFIAK